MKRLLLAAVTILVTEASLVIAAVPTASAKALSFRCEGLFEARTKPVNLRSQFQSLPNQPLSTVEAAALAKHPIMKLKASLGEGEGAAFVSDVLGVESSSVYKGEWTFTAVAVRYLKALFPKAQFMNSSKQVSANRKRYELLVMDPSEAYSKENSPSEYDLYVTKGGSLPIPFAKATRAFNPEASKGELRKRFGFTSTQKVLSLYVRAADTMTDMNPRQAYNHTLYDAFFKKLRSAFEFDIVVVTFGNHVRGGYSYSGIARALDGFKSIEWHEKQDIGSSAIDNKTILANGTYGLLPYVHKAADLAVVIGPVNFFEPLAVGTPTLILRKADSETHNSGFSFYDKTIYAQLIATAVSTGLAEMTPSIAGIPGAVNTLMTRVQQPDFRATPIADAAIPPFLDALEKHIRFLLVHGKTPKP